ncbi:MAG TPA: outer membrane beta-barrel protein [Mucilaginibacter sp.]|nr:outer membrane beta-barrel protein [Mucilaginibacter sp.]
MKKLLLVVFCCLIWAGLRAQTTPQMLTVKGITIDSTANKPLGYVTVALQDAATKQSVKAALSKDDGSFELKAPAGKAYQLVLASVGYKNKIIAITGADAFVNVGKVLLAASSNQLNEVSVTAARPLMKQEVDRISYDVQADPDSKALSVLDMMRKVPLLSVDGNDNIQLKGSGNYKILINGKESALVAKNPSDILKSMPATNIEKIEVITTPPAKYDAEGLAGIINIITKKNADQGYNIGINSRFNTVFGPGYNINGTLKQGKFGMSVFGGFGSNGTLTTSSGNTENIFASHTNILQNGYNTQTGKFHYGGTEMSYEIDTLNLITASVDLFGNNQNQHGPQFSNTDSLGIPKQVYTLNNSGNSSFTGMDLSLNYQLGFKHSKDRLLTFSYKYSYSPNKQFNDNVFSDRYNYSYALYPDYQQYNDAGNKDHTIQVDYASPLNKQLSIEAGAKAILRNNYSNYHVDDRDTLNQQYNTNSALTNDFNYHQDIYSLYNSYQLKLDKWTGKAGLRLEHTALSADFISAGVTTAPSYSNLIPSVSIQRSFKTSSINFGYTQRIQRPGIFNLNPFVDRSNPTFITAGNPELKPELDNTFELTYSNFTKNSINIGLSYAFSNNSIQNVSSLRTEQVGDKLDTVTYTTFENLGTNKTLSLNVNTNLNLTKQFTLGLNGQVNHVWLSGTFDGSMYHNGGFTGNAFGNMRYKFDKGYAISFNAGFFSGNVNLQGNSSAFVFNQYLFSKDLFNKKMTIVLVANNPYSKYNTFRSNINSTEFYQSSYNQNYYRSFAVRFNFRFGKLNGNIKKNEHGIENDDTKGGNKSGGNSGG